MRTMLPAYVAFLSVITQPASAVESDGWGTDVELKAREWRPETLDWARQFKVPSPTEEQLLGYTPPPREMWCAEEAWAVDCDSWDLAMTQWLHQYLRIPYEQPLPTYIPMFPKECPSSCDTW